MVKKQLERLSGVLITKARTLASSIKHSAKSIDWNRMDQLQQKTRKSLHNASVTILKKGKTVLVQLRETDWKAFFQGLKGLDWVGFIKENKPVVMAGACLVLVSTFGIYSFANIDKNLFGPKQVDFVGESAAAKQALADNPTLSNIKNVNPARRIGVSGFSILADGRAVGFAATQTEADKILDALKKAYTVPGATESWFVETVVVKPDRLDIVKFDGERTVEDAVHQIAKGTTETQQHVIQQGENLWLIAQKYKISVDTLIAANPEINPEKVKIDQKISLVVPRPLISVACKEVKEYNELIPFEVAYEESGSIYKGESTVKRAGVQGERFVKAEIVRINGKEIERKILDEKVSKNPIGKIVVKGTKNPPPKIGSGKFVWPTSRGSVTSKFGKRWGRMHEGIDIGLPIGSQIKASDGGKVTFSGYKNGYGLTVIINHGGGYSTLYGHNSKLLVKAGQSVFQGQAIAKSGNTGRSTGPHLHFEVQKNGRAVNPMNFLHR